MAKVAGNSVIASEEEFSEAMQEGGGFCLTCGAVAHGVEPDAERYRCDYCDALTVYGAEQLLIMGRLSIAKTGEAQS